MVSRRARSVVMATSSIAWLAAGLGSAEAQPTPADEQASPGTDDAGQETPSEADPARDLFDRANQAMKDLDYAQACDLYRESFELSEANGPLLYWARCETARGRLATALGLWRRVRDRFLHEPRVQQEASEQIAQLETRVATITVRRAEGAAGSLKATIDGKAVPFDKPIPVDRGEHVVTTSGDESAPAGPMTVTVEDGEAEAITVGSKEGHVVTTPAASTSSPWVPVGIAALVAGGVGAIGFAVTGPLVLAAESDLDEACPDRDACTDPQAQSIADRGNTLGILNAIAAGVGLVGLAGGTAILLLADTDDTAVWLEPGGGVDAASLELRGRF